MALWCCNNPECRSLYAVGLYGGCPHCHHPDFHEFGTWPEDEEHPMSPKITRTGGPSYGETAGADQGEEEPRVLDAEAPAAPSVPDGTMAEVLAWVGDDPERAGQALEAEEAGRNRSTLVADLTKLLEAATATEGPVDGEEPTEDPGIDDSEPVDAD